MGGGGGLQRGRVGVRLRNQRRYEAWVGAIFAKRVEASKLELDRILL